mgnify:CR=1 FL=1
MTRKVFLLLGSNLGDRKSILRKASQIIYDKLGKEVLESAIYETSAWGKEDQPPFLNQVIEIETTLTPHALLKEIAKIEEDMGRVRYERWGQRLIDIDILYYNSSVVITSNLEIPHSEIPNRRFTLVPMDEIAPEFVHPILGKTQNQLLEECDDPLEVHKL